jgi:glycosyltransferase involved in cell wall biosynthesis
LKTPTVSVVVSCYNRPAMLEVALNSVLHQTLREIEIIVQDDSTDAACEELVASIHDERIRYTHNRPSLGTGNNLVAGYRKCRGKYFSTLNDDDIYSPEYLATMVAAMEENPSCSLAFSSHYVIDALGKVDETETNLNDARWGRANLPPGLVSDPIRSVLLDKCVPGMFAVFRSSMIDLDDFPQGVLSAYDYWLTYLAVRDGRFIYYVPKRLTYYRVHHDTQTSSFASPAERLRLLQYNEFIDNRLLADIRLRTIRPGLRRRLAGTLASRGFANLRLSRRGEAYQAFQASLRTKLNMRAFGGTILRCVPQRILRLILSRSQSDLPPNESS